MRTAPRPPAPLPARRRWAWRLTLAACLLGGVAAAGSVTVSFPLRGHLISSDAPNRVTLTTP